MIYFVPFLILIYYFDLSLSWLIENRNTGKLENIQNIQNFKTIIERFKWDQDLKLNEGFIMMKPCKNIESIDKNTKFPKSFSTFIKYFHYKNLMKIFGNILLDEEMNKNEIVTISLSRKI